MSEVSSSQRFAEQVWAFYKGQCVEVVAWLERLGCVVAERNESEGEYIIDGLAGVRCGLLRGMDPPAICATIGFLLAGLSWPIVLGDGMREVRARWSDENKAWRATRAGRAQ